MSSDNGECRNGERYVCIRCVALVTWGCRKRRNDKRQRVAHWKCSGACARDCTRIRPGGTGDRYQEPTRRSTVTETPWFSNCRDSACPTGTGNPLTPCNGVRGVLKTPRQPRISNTIKQYTCLSQFTVVPAAGQRSERITAETHDVGLWRAKGLGWPPRSSQVLIGSRLEMFRLKEIQHEVCIVTETLTEARCNTAELNDNTATRQRLAILSNMSARNVQDAYHALLSARTHSQRHTRVSSGIPPVCRHQQFL